MTSVAVAQEALPRVEGPLTMSQAVELALAHSRKVKAAAADQRAMRSMQREATAGFYPQASLNGYLARQNMVPNVYTSVGDTMARNYQVFGANRTQDLNLTVMWPLFSGGRTYYGYKAARSRAEAAALMREATELDVATQARFDYIAAVREQENARVASDLVRQTEERLRVSREEFDAGRAARFVVLRDEAELANAVQFETTARNQAALALVALKTTLGVDLASPIAPSEPLEYAPSPVSVEEGIRAALAAHPEAQVAEKRVDAAQSDLRSAYGRYLPELSASWMYDWQRMRNRDMPFDSPEGYSVGLVLTVPLFDGFMRENAVQTARARQEQAEEQVVLARQQIAKAVHQAALSLQAAEQNIEASRKGLTQAEEQFRIVQERYASGRGIQLEVLDSQTALARARFNVVAALADFQTARALWLQATGRVR
ncbi:MAG: TolC family protein [candidate division NC10 bacterium]|nr:TolC family protein [candidate division NC10 bacterium]